MFEDKRLNVWERAFLIFVVLNSGTAYALDYATLSYVAIVLYCGIIFTRRVLINRRFSNILLTILFLTVFWGLQYLINDNGTSFINIIKNAVLMFMVFSYIIQNRHKYDVIVFFLCRIILFISIVSSVIFLLHLAGISLPIIYTKAHNIPTVYYIESFTRDSFYGLFGYRNYGMYWEPGMYQIYLNFMLIAFLYRSEYKLNKKLLLAAYLVLCILTTGSVTGYVCCVFIIGIYAFNNANSMFFKGFTVLCCLVAVIIIFPYMQDAITTKLTMGKSYTIRTNDYTIGFEVFKNRPLFGYGLNNTVLSDLKREIALSGSNGIINVLVNFGTVGAFAYFFMLRSFVRAFKKMTTKNAVIPLIGWLLLSCASEPITLHAFIYGLMAIGIGERIAERENE